MSESVRQTERVREREADSTVVNVGRANHEIKLKDYILEKIGKKIEMKVEMKIKKI